MSATPRTWKLFMLPPTAIALEAFLFPADEEGNLVGQAVAAARDEVIAGRILRAVNAHDALVGAVTHLMEFNPQDGCVHCVGGYESAHADDCPVLSAGALLDSLKPS